MLGLGHRQDLVQVRLGELILARYDDDLCRLAAYTCRQDTSFNTATLIKSSGTYTLPEGTTRIKGEISVTDRAGNDLVYFDRVGIMLGSSGVWRNGTGRSVHAVWHAPVLQYDDDGSGYGVWQELPGLATSPPVYDLLSGNATYTDQAIVPLVNRRYRAQTISFGLAGDWSVSRYGSPSDEVSLTALNWWLKDITDPASKSCGSRRSRPRSARPARVACTSRWARTSPSS
ncbi:hypothetical protein OG785_32140 [Streptomyces sp. NBC_00006]|uniref:hypothetical protein n=1 Tax=Streptomyces sp. NBC_00006 TaxID=2975619 RepID=UPI0022545C9F|nr:hypothetical protein [Streptomyces sp. NBC_00006]MCX5535191.1 hypothetical protein [Streptomyces sp. NBC_00006]